MLLVAASYSHVCGIRLMGIIESYTGVVATYIKYYAPLCFHWAFDLFMEISPIPLKIGANFFQGYQEWD